MKTAAELLKIPFLTYRAPLDKAKDWIHSGDAHSRQEAIILLEGLRERFPHAIEVVEDLAFAYLEAGKPAQARRVIESMGGVMSEEVLCRLGRTFKEQGDVHALDNNDAKAAKLFYDFAFAKYAAAYIIRRSYYPGVNMAGLKLASYAYTPPDERQQQDLDESRRIATDLLQNRIPYRVDRAEDQLWQMATVAECRMLLQQWSDAAALFQQVVRSPACFAAALQSIRRHVDRNLRSFRRIGITDFGPLDPDKVLPLPPVQEPAPAGTPRG